MTSEATGATASTRFLLFSLSKTITAVTVAALVDRGDLSLPTPVADLVPAFATNGKEIVTVEHVLSHTGGFADDVNASWLTLSDFAEWEVAVARMCAAPFKPEEFGKPKYHGLAYSVLGAVIEAVTGAPFPEACQELVLRPLGMTSTTWGLSSEVPAGRLVGPTAGAWDLDVNTQGVVPAGNAWSTAADVGRLFLMLREKGAGLLAAETVEEFLRPRGARAGDQTGFALGFSVVLNWEKVDDGGVPDVLSFGHAGYTATIAFHDLASDLTVVALTNLCADPDGADGRFDTFLADVYRRFVPEAAG